MQRLVWPTRLCAATEDARDKFSVFESYRPSCGAVTYFVVWRCPRKSAGPGSVTHRHEIFCPAWPGVSEVSLEETAHFVLGVDGTAEKTEPPRLLARRRQAWSRAGDRRLPRIHLGSVAQDSSPRQARAASTGVGKGLGTLVAVCGGKQGTSGVRPGRDARSALHVCSVRASRPRSCVSLSAWCPLRDVWAQLCTHCHCLPSALAKALLFDQPVWTKPVSCTL